MRFEYRSDVRESLAAMSKYFLSVVDAYRNMDKVSVDLELLGERPCTGDVDQEKQEALVNKALDIIEAFTGKRVECESGFPPAFPPSALADIWEPALTPVRSS